jgi:ubiquinol-cytochrome c reductase cytochrome b subunit
MRLLKTHPVLGLVNSYVIDSPQPTNISYMWNFGSLLALCLGIQIVTGIILAMHYIPNIDFAFVSVEHIMRDVNYGWLIRYLHANTASFFFIFVYLHIGRGIYYGSYKSPRILTWSLGVIIFILMIGTAFLGYVLPYGQMSLWGATVITNLLSAIPWIGKDLVEFIWGGFSVNNATLNRFFSLHYLLPFILAALAVVHMLSLHSSGSSNPLGITGNTDRIPMYPYFIFKDLITILMFFMVLGLFVFYMPNYMGHSDNYIPANPMVTPPSIVPEWYLLPYYAILRSIPNKLLGVIAMFSSLLILLLLPILDVSRVRGSQFRPLAKVSFWVFVVNFFVLLKLGSAHVENPFITLGMICTALYFTWFLVIVPTIGLIENTLLDLATEKANLPKTSTNK